jgi:Tetratricopeptide repeat/Cytochrome c554 and c-prime
MTIRWLHGRSLNEPVARCGLGATIAILAAMPGLFYAARASAEVNHSPRADSQSSRASPVTNDGYVGSAACSRCHAEIYNHFLHTSMGRSLTPVTPEFLHSFPVSASLYDQKSNRHFEVHTQNGKLYQSEYQVDEGGKHIFRNTHTIDLIVGTNANGLSGLVQHDSYLFEAPLSYYKEIGSWALSPGYEKNDQGFSRVIAPGCISCHSGRPQPVANTIGKYEDPAFSQLSVGCENCHGPGSAHVHAMGMGESFDKGKDPTIVNPGNLTPVLADNICESCHQTGDIRVFQPGKTYQDFRPGQPLGRVLAILITPPTRENPPREDHVEHYYSMILSKCYRESASKPSEKQMRCISCHDPHIEPTSEEAPAFFNGKCMSCHTTQSCKAPMELRAKALPGSSVTDNCIGCHMPKRAGGAISHTSLTNHRIVARPDEPFPDAAFEMTTVALPDLIYLDARPREAAPPAVTLLQAYNELKERSPAYQASFLKTLHELESLEPENALVQATLGHQALSAGHLDEAEQHLQESVKIDPAQPEVYVDLSAVADQKGQIAEAVELAQKAVTLDPFSAPKQKTLVTRLIDAKRYPEAEAAMEKYLQNFPEDDFMRKMLAIAKQD